MMSMSVVTFCWQMLQSTGESCLFNYCILDSPLFVSLRAITRHLLETGSPGLASVFTDAECTCLHQTSAKFQHMLRERSTLSLLCTLSSSHPLSPRGKDGFCKFVLTSIVSGLSSIYNVVCFLLVK